MTLDGLLSGTIGVLIGVMIGPLFTAWVQSWLDHRNSLRAVRGEIRANLAVFRAHTRSVEGYSDQETMVVPIGQTMSTEIFSTMAAAVAIWGEGTLHHVALHYSLVKQFQHFADAQSTSAIELNTMNPMVENIHNAQATARALFRGACASRDEAIRCGVIALEWIDDELERTRPFVWEDLRPFTFADMSK